MRTISLMLTVAVLLFAVDASAQHNRSPAQPTPSIQWGSPHIQPGLPSIQQGSPQIQRGSANIQWVQPPPVYTPQYSPPVPYQTQYTPPSYRVEHRRGVGGRQKHRWRVQQPGGWSLAPLQQPGGL